MLFCNIFELGGTISYLQYAYDYFGRRYLCWACKVNAYPQERQNIQKEVPKTNEEITLKIVCVFVVMQTLDSRSQYFPNSFQVQNSA